MSVRSQLLSLAVIGVATCAQAPAMAETQVDTQPFHLGSANITSTDIRNSLSEASADFGAVIAGKCPVFAKFKTGTFLPADGGTVFFYGHGYRLTIAKSLTNVGLTSDNGTAHVVSGYLYGPSITFDPTVMAGNGSTVGHVTFYSADALNTLLGGSERDCTNVSEEGRH